jgi:DNA-binding LacI/PurR family transcriptional regulator/AraC-like DNA-binding protein
VAQAGKKRIGLILASIHTGSAQNVWSSFAREAAAEDAALFVFPGGVLNSPADLEYLRNPIFSLANPHNLDGLISWSSAIGNTISPEEFRAFHESFASLPYVTIAHKVPGRPCVQFDAYQGMKNLVSHFIHEHGARKIAFLRGPETHVSALDRFRGYRDALGEAGLAYDEALVTDPAGWARGAAACAQLAETRGLLPGRGFDTLIGSSDMMALPAIQYLSGLGYSTPADYRAGGFNNSIESRILSTPLSTVHMPYAELSGESFKILKGLLEARPAQPGPKGEGLLAPQPNPAGEGSPLDVVLPCELIIRESCGCSGEWPAASGRDAEERAESLGRALKEQEHAYTYAQYQRETWHTALNSLKCELLGTRDRKSLIQSLARHLPKIGITTAAVMLYEDGDLSECVGNFSPGGLNTEEKRQFPADHLFPAEMEGQYAGGVFMVQPLFIENRSLGYFIHNVPFYDGVILEELRSTVSNAFKGIFLFEETDRAKRIAEQAERAKTEFFAAIGNNLYDPFSELIDSIDDLEKSLPPADSGGKAYSRGSPQALKVQIAKLRSLAVLRQERANHLIDLSLSQIDELSFSQELFNIADMFPDLIPQGPFPLLAADKARFQDTVSLIREVYGGALRAKLRLRGLELHFDGQAAPPSIPLAPSLADSAGAAAPDLMQLAERIVLIHQGELTRDEKGCSVLIPWPAYMGHSSARPSAEAPNGGKYLLALSPLPIDAEDLFGLPLVGSLEKALANPERVALILWDAGAGDGVSGPGAGEAEANANANAWAADALEGYKKVAALRSQAAFFHTPFLCFGTGLAGETLSAAVDAKLQNEKTGTILFIGIDEAVFPWIDREQRAHINTAADLADAAANEPPGLIVIGGIDGEAMETIGAIRRHPVTAMTAVIAVPERVKDPEAVEQLCRYPRTVLCHRSVAKLGEFSRHVRAIAAGAPILPLYTGALVKKTLLYFDQHAKSHISRWKLADSVNVSEDYLTRVFRREMGCSLWEYLNQYRVCLAAELLTHTGDTISEIAACTGFRDQAYFCRVFKKIYGVPPGQLREGNGLRREGNGLRRFIKKDGKVQ